MCLAERRRLAVAGMSPRRNRPPPALRTPSVPFIKPHRATAGRRASFAALRNAMSVIGAVSSDHHFRLARAIASAIRELRFGTREHFPQEHRSARERRPLKATGAHSSQRAGSTTSLPPSTETTAVAIPKFMTKLRFLIWPAAYAASRTPGAHLALTWRIPGAHLAHPVTQAWRTPVALLCRTPVALLSHPVAHSWLSRCGPPSGQRGNPAADQRGNSAGQRGNSAGQRGNSAGQRGNSAGQRGNSAGQRGNSAD